MHTQLMDSPTPQARASRAQRPLRVCMMDVLPTVPYYTASLSASLREIEGVEVSVESIPYYLDPALFERLRIPTDPMLLDFASRFRKGSARLGRIFKLIEYLINLHLLLLRCAVTRPDVLHVQFLPAVKFGLAVELWFVRAARMLGCRTVYTVHNVLPQDTGEKYREIYRRIYHLVDRLICHDDGAKARLINEFGVQAERISVIPHGPLLEKQSEIKSDDARRRRRLASDEPLVLWQGILRPYKGVSFLLRAWKLVQASGVRGRLVIAGNGDAGMVDDIRREAESLGLGGSVTLDLRFIPVEELVDYFTAADVLVYPYREITTSGALMTGIGYGKAIVATDHSAFRGVLSDGESALLVPYGDTAALANSIVQLIQDCSLRERLAAGARAAYARATQWSDIAVQTVACYEIPVGEECF